MLHKTRVAIRFRAKNSHHRLPENLRWYACDAAGRSGGRCTGSLPHFLTHGARLRALRAQELRYERHFNCNLSFLSYFSEIRNFSGILGISICTQPQL